MRLFALCVLLSVSVSALANNEILAPKEICSRLEVVSEVFVYDSKGEGLIDVVSKRKLKVGERQSISADKQVVCRVGHGSGIGSSLFPERLNIHANIMVMSNGELKVKFTEYSEDVSRQEYENIDKDKILFEREVGAKFFESFAFTSVGVKSKKVVVRYIPKLSNPTDKRSLAEFPIVGRDVQITDDLGNLWVDHFNVSNNFVGISTHKGTLAISFTKFKGAKEIGKAEGKRMKLNLGDRVVSLRSDDSFLPGDMVAKVYGQFDLSKKTSGLRDVHASSSSSEEGFLEHDIFKKR